MKKKRISEKFEQEMLCQFKVDEEYELYVRGWIAYNKAANRLELATLSIKAWAA